MPRFSPERLHTVLRALAPADVHKLAVGYSGGLDSTVLLASLASIAATSGFRVRALHVNHQLQAASAEWSRHCAASAAKLGIPCSVLSVVVEAGEEGLEAGARRARYAAFRSLLQPDEALLTAHHADDQLETVLLALMRGAGVPGLAAVPPVQPFAQGVLIRPLLEFTREELEAWARAEGLIWIEDPMNENVGFDRTYLRHRVVPLLKDRWPSAATSAVRSSAHVAQAAQLLDELAAVDGAAVRVGPCLDVGELKRFTAARRRNVLRHWLKECGVRPPSTRKLAALEHDILVAQSDRIPRIEIEHAVLHRHRELLYCEPAPPELGSSSLEWSINLPLELPAGLGQLHLEPSESLGVARNKLPERLTISFRDGGETIRVAPDRPRRELKKLLQESNILPWWRRRLPLIYAGDALVAVGDLWIDAAFMAHPGEPSWKIHWFNKPAIVAISK